MQELVSLDTYLVESLRFFLNKVSLEVEKRAVIAFRMELMRVRLDYHLAVQMLELVHDSPQD